MAGDALGLLEKFATDPTSLSGDEMVEAFLYVETFNASKPSGTPPLAGPRLEQVVLAFHPTLICGEGVEKVEWFVCKDHQIASWDDKVQPITLTVPLYEPVPSIDNLLGRILHKLKRPTDGWRNEVIDLRTSLSPKCAIRDLARSVLKIDLAQRRATHFEDDPAVSGVVACKSCIYLLRKDGSFTKAPYDRTTFVLNRLPADPDNNPLMAPTQTQDWVTDRLGADQAKAFWDWAAYSLTPRNTYKRIALWLGETDSGKSTGVRLLTKILGSHNVASYTAEQLVRPFILAELRGKLLNVGEEDPGYGHKFEAILKTISGGTAVPWEIKYGASGASVPTFKCLFTSNNPPGWVDSSGAYGRRMVILRWGYREEDPDGSASIPLHKQLPMSEFDEMFEEELPGILWMLLTLRGEIVKRNDIYVPEESRLLVEQIAKDSNSVATWLAEATDVEPTAALRFGEGERPAPKGIEKHEVYEAYAAWCKASGNQAYSYQTFFRKLKQHPSFKNGTIREEKQRVAQGRLRKFFGMTLPTITFGR